MKDFIEIKGSRIYYEATGKGETIVFIHADSLDRRMWNEQFDYFAKNHQTIRYDIRGFGKSDVPSIQPYSFAEDLKLLLSHLSIGNAHLVGLSLGGAIAIDFALMYPDKVSSLILADSGIGGHGFSDKFLYEVNEVISLAKDNRLVEAKKAWLNLSFFSYSKKVPEVWTNIEQMVLDSSGYRWYGKNQPTDLNPPAAERLNEINVPTLLIVGEYDIEDFQNKVPFMKQRIKRSKVSRIPHAGHLSNMDNPQQFNKEIELFLSSLK